MYESNFWTFVTTKHSPKLMRRGQRPNTEVSMLCACGKQTKWRVEARRLAVQQDWVTHVHEERAKDEAELPRAAGM